MRLRRILLLAGLLLIATLAAAQVAYSTRLGVWAESDSAAYLAAARSVLSGDGLRVIQPSGKAATLMPPLYPLLLAGAGGLGLDLPAAARGLNITLAFASILLFGWIGMTFGRSRGLALPAVLLLAGFPAIVELYSGMMTEPLYLTLMLFGFGALLAYLENSARGWLLAAGVAAGWGVLTRFVGVVFLPAGVLAVLLLSRTGWKRRLGDLLLFSAASMLPVLIWAVWLYFNPDSSPALGGPQWTNPWAYLAPVRNGFFKTLWSWLPFANFLPGDTKLMRLATVLGALLLPALAVLGAWRLLGNPLRGWLNDADVRLAALAVLSIACFLIGFILIYLFRNPPQDVNQRTLLPLYPLFLFLLTATVSLWLRGLHGWGRTGWIVLCALLVAAGCWAYLPASLQTMQTLHDNGRGYVTPAWQNSETLRALREVPADLTLISNENGAILFFTGRTALEVRERFRSEPAPVFTRFGDDPQDEVQALFHDGRAALVIFKQPLYWQLNPIYGDQTQARIDVLLGGLTPLFEGADGGIYLYPLGQ